MSVGLSVHVEGVIRPHVEEWGHMVTLNLEDVTDAPEADNDVTYFFKSVDEVHALIKALLVAVRERGRN